MEKVRLLIFSIAVLLATLLVLGCISVLASHGGDHASFWQAAMAALLLAGCAVWTWAEWHALRYGTRVTELRLGVFYLGVCVLGILDVAGLVGVAILWRRWPFGFHWLIVVLMSFATYFGIVGFIRVRAMTLRDVPSTN